MTILAASNELMLSRSGARFPAIWLRINCPCPTCRSPLTGERLLAITEVPRDIRIVDVNEMAEAVAVEYAPEGHRSVFARAWLESHSLDGGVASDGRTEADKWLWQARDIQTMFPEAEWGDFVGDRACRAACLEAVMRLGFVLLHDVPCEPNMVLRVTRRFGYVRETNYGSVFDVRVQARPNNLASTDLPIGPHTDNPYRDPVPTLQLLHCLINAAEGGETALVDGFEAAATLRRDHPHAFALLSRTPAPFRFRDGNTELCAVRPLIDVDGYGRIREVRFSHRHLQPLHLRFEDTVAFYSAYRHFTELVCAPERQLAFKLSPGDCLIFDNTRVLHARTAFSSSGERHLQGCYADLDALASTLAVLRREVSADALTS